MKKSLLIFVFAVCCLAVIYFVLTSGGGIPADGPRDVTTSRKSAGKAGKTERGGSVTAAKRSETEKKEVGSAVSAAEAGQASTATCNDDDRESEIEKQVEMFDELTDMWSSDPEERRVTMADVEKFQSQFRKLPADRKDECLQRALNLIPDENVMLLAGILFDKTQDKEVLETVFNDILNRDESVKKPIMEQIFRDKTHPSWPDVAWIFDVTESAPKSR